jgi:putative spermidine/putrescine transport system substrate-binding protein
VGAAVAAIIAGSVVSAGAQQPTLTFAGFGGNLQSDISKTLLAPAAERAGVTLREHSHDGLAGVRVQVQSGAPGWDVVHLGAEDCASGAREGLFVNIDYKVVDASGIADTVRAERWIGTNTYSVVLAWRTDKYKDKPPADWKDFWNVRDFPGRRALSVFAPEMLEIALLGDGVPRDKVYPLDVERAFSALKRLKPNVGVWWSSGAQSSQLIKDGEVDMLAIWGSRVALVIADGAPVKFTYQDGIIGFGCMAIVKGAKNQAAAQKFLAAIVSPEIQARIPTMMSYYGPANSRAYDVKQFPAEVLAQSNSSPENTARQLRLQPAWWSEHGRGLRERYKNAIIE